MASGAMCGGSIPLRRIFLLPWQKIMEILDFTVIRKYLQQLIINADKQVHIGRYDRLRCTYLFLLQFLFISAKINTQDC